MQLLSSGTCLDLLKWLLSSDWPDIWTPECHHLIGVKETGLIHSEHTITA